MPTQQEKNQFRRLIGDYGNNSVSDAIIKSYLDDATYESTQDFVDSAGAAAPVTDFDNLYVEYHAETVYLGGINYLWDLAAKLSAKHTQSVGQSAQNVGERFDRVMQMIEQLKTYYEEIQQLGGHIRIGNLSRFSKQTMTRIGGQSEEDALKDF